MQDALRAVVLLALFAGCGTTSGSGDDAKSAPQGDIDVKSDPTGDIYVIRLEHARCEEMAATLNRLVAGNESIRIVSHSASNSILFHGSEEEIEALHDLVAWLDVVR